MAKRKKANLPVRQVRQSVQRASRDRYQANHDLRDLYTRGVGDTNHIANEVKEYLGLMNGNINKGYSDNGVALGASNDALQQQLQQTSLANAGQANDELHRLGIQQTGLGGFQQDANFAQMQAQNNARNDQSNNSFAQTNANSIGSLLGGMNEGQRQSNLGQLLNTRNDGITKNNNAFSDFQLQSRQNIQNILIQQAQQRAAARASARSYGGGGGYSSGGGAGRTDSKLNREATSYQNDILSGLTKNIGNIVNPIGNLFNSFKGLK